MPVLLRMSYCVLQVVPALLRAMFGLLDRMAGLQLALTPPSITHKYTGHAVVTYGVSVASLA